MKRRTFVFVAAMCVAAGLALSAPAGTLVWNGARGALWNDANWLDAGNNPVAWQDGADAVFPGGAFVEVRDSVRPASITFTGAGATLVGSGRIVLAGDLTASAAGTTNSVVARLVGDAAFTKRGAGAVAVGFAKGAATVAEGTLLVAGSRSAGLRATAAGGAVAALGAGAAAANLLANGSFEATTASGNYVYMNGTDAGTGLVDKEGTALAPWKVSEQVVLANGAGVKTWCGTITGTGVPDGDQLCILQRFGTIMQEVTVAEDGWYDLSFTYFKRGSNYQDHRIGVFVDDVTVATLFSNMIQPYQVRFASGPIWLPAGTHAVRFAGEGWEADRATFVDDIRLAPPTEAALPQSDAKAANAVSGNWSDAALWADGAAPAAGGSATASLFFPLVDGLASANDLSGTFLFNSLGFGGVASGEAATLSGNALSSRRDGSFHGYVSLDTPGALDVSAPLAVNSNLVVDVEGDLTLSGTVSQAGAEGAALEKYGRGTLTVAGNVSNVGRLHVLDGTVEMRNSLSAMNYILKSMTNTAPAVLFNIAADATVSRFVDSFGAGVPTISLRTGAGRTLTFDNTLNCYGPLTRLDVGEGDTLVFKHFCQATWRVPFGCSGLLKTGPGTLAVTEAPTLPASATSTFDGILGGIRGGITVREGTLLFHSDDFDSDSGLANIYTGVVFPTTRDGSLGHDTSVPVMLGDALTPSGASAGIGGRTAHVCSTRTFVATPYPAHVVLSSVSNGVYQMGTVVLRRGDFTLGGPTGGVEDVNVMLTHVTLDGVSAATISRSGNVRAILNATNYPAGLTLVSDRMFEVGFRRSLGVSIGGLALSGGWQVSFDAAGHDSVAATNLVLGATEVTLWDDVNETAFAQPGVYTLLRYGTLSGDVSSLTVAEACKVSGYGYAFADDGQGAITLTITTAADNPVYTWIAATGGTWGDAANWDHPAAPDGATAQAVLGPAPQAAATVTLAAPATVNALTFYNANGYTLAGASLRFDGEEPGIFAATGDHVIQSAVTNLAAAPLSVQSTDQGSVRFAGDVTGDLAVERGQATLAEGMALDGNVTVTGATLTVEAGVDITGTATLGQDARLVADSPITLDSLAGAADSAEIVANGALTLGGANSTYGGAISGTGPLVKTGATTLTLDGPSYTHTGGTTVDAGTLAVGAALLPGVTRIADGATLKSSGRGHGLVGHYYGYYTKNTQSSFANRVYSLEDFQSMLAGLTDRGREFMPLATCLSIGDGRENALPKAYAGGMNYWAAAYTANLVVPETGEYDFYAVVDDNAILVIDGVKVLSSCLVGRQVYGGCHLEAGIHTFYLGLFEITGDAYLTLYVKRPGASAYTPLPADWLHPDSGAEEPAGAGAVAADAGTVTTVGQETGFNSGFTGSFAAASGGLVQKTGDGVMSARYAGGDVAASGGELALWGDSSFGTVRPSGSGVVHIARGTIRTLTGDGGAAFGSHAYVVPRIDGDADSGFSTDKTYTHLVNFPLSSQAAVVNGVTVDNTGTWTWGGTEPGSTWGKDSGTSETGLGRMLYRFVYGSMDFSVNLSGLTAGNLYDLRLYFRNFSTSPRDVTFVFTRGDEEIGRVDWNPDRDANGKGRPYTAVGCRYVAPSAGTVTVRVISHDNGNKCHFYGFSNELLGDAGGAEAVSLAPAAGETARLAGGVSGTAALSLDGAGTQALGGAVALTAPLAVNAGRLVLESGAAVTAGVAVASGATLEMQGSAQVNGLSGAGALVLGLGDNDPWGALQADGTFAAPEWPRRVNVAGDADSGIAPFKAYTHFFNTGYGSNTVLLVNGVQVSCVLDNSGTGTAYTDHHRGCSFTGLPQNQYVSAAGSKNIVMDSSNGVWSFFNKFQHAYDVTLNLNGLTAGRAYELRLYVRNWEGRNRSIKLSYNDGAADKTFTFNEDVPPEGYIALRYTPSGTTFALKAEKQASDGFHLYAFSNEEVASRVRVVNIDADATFSGAISGNGELRKTGAGTWTLTGAGAAGGAWTVAEGALVVDGAAATTGSVAVAAGASFGGVGSAGGDVGVASGATLLAGAGASIGTLALGGDLAVADGATLKVAYDQAHGGAVAAAGAVTLPANLTVTAAPATAGVPLGVRIALVTAGTTLAGPTDFSGWSVVDADGNAIRGAQLSYGEDGRSVWLSRPVGTLLLFR